jgi:hypothetical protein
MEEYAWALHQAGHCGRAAEAFVAASQCAAAERRHLLRGHAIEALLIAGEVDRGQAVLASLLPELRIRPVWRGFWGIVQLLFLVCLVRFKAQRLRFRARPDRLALQRAEVTWAAGKAFTNLLPVDGVVHLLRSLLFALDSGDEIAIARGLNLAASGYVPFLEGKSRRLLDAASSITQKHPTPYLLGMRGVALATAATMEGNWRTALAEIEGASKHLEAADIPTHWERSVLAVNRTACLEQLGHLGEAAPFFERAAMTARQRGDMVGYVSNWASVGFCRLVANDLAGLDHVIAEYARIIGSWRVGYGIWHTALWHLEVLRALRKRDGKTARTCFDAGWPKIVAAQLHHTRAMRLYLLETRAAVLLHSEPLTRGERRAWLREASRLRRQTADTNRRDAKPNALLLSASIAHFRGDRAACVASLESAAELYASEGMCEREVTVRWRIAALQEDLATQRALEERARSLGIEDLPTWAPIRTPGFWQRP